MSQAVRAMADDMRKWGEVARSLGIGDNLPATRRPGARPGLILFSARRERARNGRNRQDNAKQWRRWAMSRARGMELLLGVVLVTVAAMGSPAYAATKIAPTEGESGHPFTLVDTPNQRIVDGSVAVFRYFGLETVLPLRTHKPYNTAQGRLAPNMYGGDYSVFLRQPNGIEFEIGLFTVLGASAPPPFIEPDLGPPGTPFTVTDYLARIQDGDLAVFYAEGTDPNTQGVVASAGVSPDGTSLTGTVPGGAAQGVQNFVSVRPAGGPSRFGDLAFFVTGMPQPTVEPRSGPAGVPFTITDPQARMLPTDVCVIYPDGGDVQAGVLIADAVITPGSATGTVPTTVSPGRYLITVRPSSVEPGRFADLPFDVDV